MPPLPTKRHPRNAAATTERILAHALEAFAARGYDGVSLDDVAARAGIRKQTLLYHFPSKDRLYAAIADHVIARFALLGEHLAQARPGAATLEQLVGELHDVLAASPREVALLVRESLDRRDQGVNDALAPFLEAGERYVRAGQRAGVFVRELDPAHAIASVVGTVMLFFINPQSFVRHARVTPAAIASHRATAIGFVRRALLARRPTRRTPR